MKNSEKGVQLEVNLDTVRVGFVPPSMSYELGYRLKARGWRFYEDRGTWNKHWKGTGLRLWHGIYWVGAEVSLPRLLLGNNNSLEYDHVQALTYLKGVIDQELSIQSTASSWTSPALTNWHVNRVDITGDCTFDDPDQVDEVIASLRTAKVAYRPVMFSQQNGVKFASKKHRMGLSMYDKFAKDEADVNNGKVRITVIINDKRNKRHLKKWGITRVGELMEIDGTIMLEIVDCELSKVRPATAGGQMRVAVEKSLV